MKKNVILISGFSLIIDQIVKYIVHNNFINLIVIPNLLSFIYTENKGAAFSILSGNVIFIIISSLILLFILIYIMSKSYLKGENDIISDISYGFLFGGILGNLIDRIFRGYVIDYVSIKIFDQYFPVFNLADMFIVSGIFIYMIRTLKEDSKK